jgi:hypothetical protein
MAFQNATNYNNGASFYGNPKDWSQYSTLTSTISFNGTNAKLKSVPESPDSNTRLLWNNEVLAYKSEIPDLADWAQYPANHQVDIPDPFVLFANAGVGGESVRSFINNLDCSTLRVSTMTVNNQVTINEIDVSTIRVSTLYAKYSQIENATVSSLTVSTINLPNPVLSVSTIDVALTLTSTLQFATLQPEVKFDLGLGQIFNNTALYAAGGLGLTIGGTAVVTGLAGAVLNRQTDYLPGVANPIELVNTTTQLQVSTLGTGQVAYFRTINPGTGAEEFVRKDTLGGDLCIRSVSDPLMNISSNGAGGTVSSFYQAFGEWVTIPRPSVAWNGEATTDLNMNASTIKDVKQEIFTKAILGPEASGLQSARNAASLQHNIVETFFNAPGYVKNVSTICTEFRTSQLCLANAQYPNAVNYDYDLGLASSGEATSRINVTQYRGGNSPTNYTIAYASDNTSNYDIYVGGGAVSGVTPDGKILTPFNVLANAIAAVNAIANDTVPVTLHIMTGTWIWNVGDIITRNNVFIVGQTSNGDKDAVTINGIIVFTVASSSAIISGVEGVNCTGITINQTASQTNDVYISGCNVTCGNNTCVFVNNSVLNTCTVNINNCVLNVPSTSTGSCVSASGNALTLNIFYTRMNQFNATNTATMVGTQCNTNMSYSILINYSTSAAVNPLYTFALTTNSTNFTGNISHCVLRYNSNATDAGNGNKCCVRITTLAGYGSYTMTILNSWFLCDGATTTNGTPGQFLCIQKTSTGNATCLIGSLIGGVTANHYPNGSGTFTRGTYPNVT